MSKIEEFWITTWTGIALFYYSPIKKLETSLITSFFSALQSFASEALEEKKNFVNAIAVGKYNYNFLSNTKYKLFFISKSLNKIKTKHIKHHLENISVMFIKNFESDLVNFYGKITKFEEFNEEFEKYFKTNFIEELKGMW